MDRNQATGLILIALLLMGYFYFFAPEPKPSNEQFPSDSLVVKGPAENEEVESDTVSTIEESDSLTNLKYQQQYGVFAAGATGSDKTFTLENENIKVDLSSQGGKISQVELKNFETYYHKPLILLDEESNNFSLLYNDNGRNINLNKLYYTPSTSSNGDTTVITYSLNLAGGKSMKHIYSLGPDSYQVKYQLELKGLSQQNGQLTYIWNDDLKTQEKDLKLSRTNTTINYYLGSEDFDGLSATSSGTQTEELQEPVKWIAIKQRFFVSGLIAENNFSTAKLQTSYTEQDTSKVKNATVTTTIPIADLESGKGNFSYYFGPNDFHILKDITPDFESNLYLGWPPMKWINRFVIIPLFDLLSSFISNYGIIIIIMVLLIKLVLSPLSYKSYLSMAKMKVLKPELDEIKEKHGDDMTKAQQEQMKLYSKVGVSPLSGCIPMLLQMPILFAMFTFFPQSIELRGKSFLWAEDLSTYDSIFHLPFEIPFYGDHVSLFVLLMTMSTILYTWSNQQVSSVQGPMKSVSYFMPIIFLFVLNSYPAALSFYYFVSNLVTFAQQAIIRKFVDEDKIRVIMDENKKRNSNKKKSKFKLRLEEAMKASQQQQQKPKKKK
ncbi:membrane protein insertase YidC [Fulvivirga sediminis]|uniref:Membrane protein insertase YidC n=1 Tax=Fulvivirga sediminis TaxID=2803949 RepID=A0A937FBM8_9BACT|nr:membrane protein insertase YidC [Fulvivirga sediminis]MBL3657598.1 membrane protein insertase YidC [Fulvivirga sediminis]